MKTADHNCIILCGGEINRSSLPVATGTSNALIPVNGKPVIGWILDDLLEKGITKVVIVTQSHNKQLIEFIRWAFEGRMKITMALLTEKGSILNSLEAGLDQVTTDQPITILLGDTLIPEPFATAENYVLVSSNYEDPRNWCIAETDENQIITKYFDKQNIQQPGLQALTGLYHFEATSVLKTCCRQALEHGAKELSAVLGLYGEKHPIKAIKATHWYDFGHMPHFLQAKRELLQSRYFNHFQIEPVSGIARKTSSKADKLRDEYEWYLTIPDALKVFTPRVFNAWQEGSLFTIEQEYYGYPNLAELYLYGNLDLEIWKATIRNLMLTHNRFREFTSTIRQEALSDMYIVKTNSRLEELIGSDAYFKQLINCQYIQHNGHVLQNWPLIKEAVFSAARALCNNASGAVIHGDYCLSNILYDINNQLVKLIDPRGSFGTKGVYGDPRYDMAKLRHSLTGAYDSIVADLFSLKQLGESTFETELSQNDLHTDISLFFDAELEKAGYKLPEIMLIEGLLFLSMIPLHKDKPQRQRMMYLTAIMRLNQVLNLPSMA